METTIQNEELIAAAMTVILKETGLDASKIRLISFREVEASPLAQYIERYRITYKKYQLGDESA